MKTTYPYLRDAFGSLGRLCPGLIVLAGSLLAAPAPALSGDAEAGRDLARRWCASCHFVEADQNRTSDGAPAFAQIANDPAKTNLDVVAWLTDPHPPMPKLSLSKREIKNLAAYIESMRTN